MTRFGLFLFLEKRVGFYLLMENLTASVLSEVSDGSFIYLRELGYVLRLIFSGMEENYSRGKRFGDKFWNGKTIDVLSVGFLFLRVSFVAMREN